MGRVHFRTRPIRPTRSMHVNDLLKIAVHSGASDLHIKVGTYPMMRVRGTLIPATEERRLEHEDVVAMAAAVLPAGHRDKFRDNHEVDLAYSVAGLGRFRCNAFQQRGTIGMIFRVIPMRVASIEDLLLPKVLKKIAERRTRSRRSSPGRQEAARARRSPRSSTRSTRPAPPTS